MDLETREINDKMEVFCISVYIGGKQNEIKSFKI
jgi:hypothetical protein